MSRSDDSSGKSQHAPHVVDIDRYRNVGSPDDQALTWIGKLRAPERSIYLEAEFAVWLDQSADNKAAFDRALELWDLTAKMDVSSTETHLQRPYRRLVPFATAASVMFATVMLVFALAIPTLSTERGEQRRLTLADGTIAHLNTQSKVRVSYTAQTRNIEVLAGEIWFDVVRDESRPFVVSHGDNEVEVLGTAFAVRTLGEDLLVSVTEGRVATRKGAHEAVLLPSHQALLTPAGIERGSFESSSLLAWRQGQLVFEDVSLPEVLSELSRYLPKNMVVADASLEATRVSAILHLTDQETMLDALGRALPIKWKQISDDLILVSTQ